MHLETVSHGNADGDVLRLTRAQLRAHIADAVGRAVAEALAVSGGSRDTAARRPLTGHAARQLEEVEAQVQSLMTELAALTRERETAAGERDAMLDELATLSLRLDASERQR
jgi:chromosome segregation ATPase